MSAPSLTNISSSVTFGENTVNFTPQLLDSDVSFSSGGSSMAGGTLTLTGIHSGESVSIKGEGQGAGKIEVLGSLLYYSGSVVGTVSSASGSDLSVTFTAGVSDAAVERLIERLQYANFSDTPVAARDFTLNITNGAGVGLGASGAITGFQAAGAADPFASLTLPDFTDPYPALLDMDKDGDLDLVIGTDNGDLSVYRNGGTGTSGSYALWGNLALGGQRLSDNQPTFSDLDGDGDLDLVFHASSSVGLVSFNNDNGGTLNSFSRGVGLVDGITPSVYGSTAFVDMDGDGDKDMVVVDLNGMTAYRNGDTGTQGGMVAWGDGDPLAAFANSFGTAQVSAVDMDGDGDLDLTLGGPIPLQWLINGTTGTAGGFTRASAQQQTVFGAIDPDLSPQHAFADVDGDGDLDLVIGDFSTTKLYTYLNTSPLGSGITLTVNVTPENDRPFADGFDVPGFLAIDAGTTAQLSLSFVTVTDPDSPILTFEIDAPAGSLAAVATADVQVVSSGSVLKLTGTIDALNAYFSDRTHVTYTAPSTADPVTLTVLVSDGIDTVTSGTIEVTVNSTAPVITGTEGNNKLNGSAVAEVINGLGGSDQIKGLAGADSMDGGAGSDTVIYTGSNLGVNVDLNVDPFGHQTAFGGHADGDVLTGFENIRGSSFGDVLTGNIGRNILRGDAGADAFVFNTALTGKNGDRIQDFHAGQDEIWLDSAIFTALTVDGLTAAAFAANQTGLAATTDTHIIYETDTGRLYYDADGTGSGRGLVFAQLAKNLALTVDDFVLLQGGILS